MIVAENEEVAIASFSSQLTDSFVDPFDVDPCEGHDARRVRSSLTG